MNLGILHPSNFDYAFAEDLRKSGFNTLYINVSPFWEQTETGSPKEFSYEFKQEIVAQKMRAYYEDLKDMGFTFFIIDAGWGLGNFDNNYFYEKIYKAFEDCEDVLFDWGECYEDYVETKKMTLDEYYRVAEQRINLISGQLSIGATSRNKDRLGATSLTSYCPQEKYWRKTDKYLWIFGQLAWHNLFGSLDYESKAKWVKENGVGTVLLYQFNPSSWSWLGFENKIGDILGCRQSFEKKQREEFIKAFI